MELLNVYESRKKRMDERVSDAALEIQGRPTGRKAGRETGE
jgi:hypothetical protein